MVYLPIICWLLATCSLVYYAGCVIAAIKFHGAVPDGGTTQPALSILKPLKGCDPEMYESLRSHCLQAYPEFEIVFGVNHATDEAIPFIDRLKGDFPNIPMRTVVSSGALGANRKVSNLAQMLRVAKHEHVLINDGDIRVPADYLQEVAGAFYSDDPQRKAGIVTCLYRGVAGKTIWSELEAMGINTDFMAGVLVAKLIDGDVRFALGSTMATTKEAIAAIGGLETLVDYLADDYELGNRITKAGYRAAIASPVVETFLPDYSFGQFLDHQLRWGRTVRSSRPGGYLGMVFTFGPLWALLALLTGRSLNAAWLLALTLLGKTLVTFAVGRTVIGDRAALKRLWLLPLRELITPAVWLMSFFGNKIVWRGEVFTLHEGKLQR